MITVIQNGKLWELRQDGERLGTCEGTFVRAVDAFMANWPELSDHLGQFLAEDLCGPSATCPVLEPQKARRAAQTSRPVRGSGQRFRELYGLGKSNEEALAIVRSEFPESKAKLSDAAWNRAKWKKEQAPAISSGPVVEDEDLL